MKAARFMLTLRRMNFRLANDMTVTELLAAHGQDADLTFKLWEPLCIAALNTPIHKASAQVLLNVLRDALNRTRADSDMLLPRIDFTALFPQRAAALCRTTRRQGAYLLRRGRHRPARRRHRTCHRDMEPISFSHVIWPPRHRPSPPNCCVPIAALADTVAQIDGSGTPADLYRVSAISRPRHPAPPDARPAPALQPMAVRQGTDRGPARPARRRHQRGRHPSGIEPGTNWRKKSSPSCAKNSASPNNRNGSRSSPRNAPLSAALPTCNDPHNRPPCPACCWQATTRRAIIPPRWKARCSAEYAVPICLPGNDEIRRYATYLKR